MPPTTAAHTAPPKLHGIFPYRDKRGVQAGWKLNIRRRATLFHRSFNAAAFGGLDGALQAALALRDEINRKHPVMSKREWCATLRSTNTSGVPGVSHAHDRTGEYWTAHVYLSNGRQKTRQFSVSKYGDDEAYRLAVEARRKLLALVEGPAPGYAPARHRHPPIVDFDEVVRQPASLNPEPNPYAPPLACEEEGVYVAHVRSKTPSPDGSFQVTPYLRAMIKREDGTLLSRYFSVPRHGDEEAKRQAIAQRQAWEGQRARGEPYTVQRGGASGVQGVLCSRNAWVASIRMPDGRIKTHAFAIKKHGDEEARRMAIAQRQVWEAQRARGEPLRT